MKMKLFLYFFLGALVLLSIAACHSLPAYVINPVSQNLTAREQQLLKDIEPSGIQVIKHGMVFTFVIPTDCFFTKDTRELKSYRDRDIDRVAEFLDSYSHYFANARISVTGYTDKTWIAPARDLLSLHYAETIATYLREDGLDSKVISVVGAGAKSPIASNQYPMGMAFNRRVVVVIQ